MNYRYAAVINKIFPFLEWMPQLKNREVLRADFVAGLTVALVLIPQSMAYAQLAGLPVQFGLYIAFLPVLVAALWGSSRQLASGPVAVVSLLTATALAPMVGGTALSHPELASTYIALAMFMSLLVGLFQLSLGVFRLGVVVNFLSHPVIVGFTNAAALVIGLSQLSKIFGVKMPGDAGDHFLHRIWGVLQQIGDTHIPTLIMGLSALLAMWLLRKHAPKLPGVLIVVAASILISWGINFEAVFNGAVVGSVPEGLPTLGMPEISVEKALNLLPSAMVIALIGFVEAISIAKVMAAKTKDRLDPNQELIGQGLANIVGSFSQSYPASGSFSRSAVNINSGARTGFASVVTALLVVITLLFLTPMLYHLPQAVLAAVIMMAVVNLINITAVKHAWRAQKHDGIAAVVTFCFTLGFAPHLDKGIMFGTGLALGLYLYRTMKPRVALLGRYPDGTLRDLSVNPGLPTDENIIVLRFDGSLYFANVSYFEDTILEAVSSHKNAKYILVVGDGINQLDASGEDMLHHLIESLRDNGITLVFSGLKKQILDVMHRTHLFEILGQQNLFATENMALKDIYRRLEKTGSDAVLLPANV